MRASSVVAALVAVGLTAGCGDSDDPPPPTTVSVTVPATTAATSATTTTPETTLPAEPDGGDGSTPEPGSGEGAANAVIAAAAVLTTEGTTEQACGSYVTENFIATAYGGEANCIAARQGEALARSITVRGSAELSTHIVVVPKGGPYDGAKVEVDLVESGGGFRVDALDAHVAAGP
jgi:hypothetical protein